MDIYLHLGGGAENWTKEVNIGPYCVSLFLFFSGYGLMSSYEKKRDAYLKGFVPHHLGRVILPLATAYIVTLPIYKMVYGSIDWHHVLSTLYWGGPYLKFSWYVTEVIVLYLLFYVIMRSHQKDAVKINRLTLAVLLLMGVLFITQQPVWYIESLPAFIVGNISLELCG